MRSHFAALVFAALCLTHAAASPARADGPLRRVLRGTAVVAVEGTRAAVRGTALVADAAVRGTALTTRAVARGTAIGTRAAVNGAADVTAIAARGTVQGTRAVVRGTSAIVDAGVDVMTPPYRYSR